MRYDCPFCQQTLRKKLLRSKPAPGERRFLPNRAIPYCSNCGGELANNPHPLEKIQLIVLVIMVIFIQLVLINSGNISLLVLTGVVLVSAFIMIVYIHFKYLRNWQRFIRLTTIIPKG